MGKESRIFRLSICVYLLFIIAIIIGIISFIRIKGKVINVEI